MNGNDVAIAPCQDASNPADTLHRRARVEPDRSAFAAGDEVWTYRRLATESERLAGAMLARGIQAGDRVALHMANLPELAVAYYACFHVGAIAAPLNIRLKAAELRPLLQRLRPALYLGQDQFYSQVAPIEPEVLAPNARFVVGDTADAADVRPAQPWASLVKSAAEEGPIPRSPSLDAPAVLLTTSGTTGQPKLVVHTPATLAVIAASFARVGLSSGQTVLLALPMVHGAGFTIFLSCIHFGAPVVLLERFDPDIALDAIEAHRCSWVMGVPFMWAEMLQHQQERPRQVGSLRHCISAGDVCPPGLQEEFAAAFGDVPLRSVLASSEIAWSLTYGLQTGPVSHIAPGTEVRVVDDAGAAVPRGETGELLVRSPSVTPGYWAGPGWIEGAPEDGWCRTGDLVRQGKGDDLWFVARKKDLIVRGGSNIAPAEVEQALLAHPAVRDAAAVGVPDPVLGQRVAALVQLEEGGAEDDTAALDSIRAEAAAQLADYKVPERLLAVEAIPRNAMGKLDCAAALAMVPGTAAADEPAAAAR